MYLHKYFHWRDRSEFILKSEGLPAPFQFPGARKFVPAFPSSRFTLFFYLILVLQILLSTTKCQNPTDHDQFCPLSLSVPETAMGVTLNAQQHSDSEYVQAIHR